MFDAIGDGSTYPQGSGLSDTDLLIFFSGDPDKDDSTECGDSTMGFAAYCETNSYDRPIAGYVNLCKDNIEASSVFTWEEAITLIIHEVFHVLGIIYNI